MTELSPRQRVLRAMHRQVPDKVPKFADFSPGIYKTFLEQTGSSGDHEIVEHKGRPGVTFDPTLQDA